MIIFFPGNVGQRNRWLNFGDVAKKDFDLWSSKDPEPRGSDHKATTMFYNLVSLLPINLYATPQV